MILAWLIVIPVVGGLAAWLAGRASALAARWVALLAMAAHLALAVTLALRMPGSLLSVEQVSSPVSGAWLAETCWEWIPQLGARFHLAADGLSLLMILLTGFLGIVAVLVSWSSIEERVGFFHLNLLLVLGGVTGVFLAVDLFLFYFLWELMLVPMYFLIDVWGHENRHYAAVKFFLFTQLSGLLMLSAILALYFIHGRATGLYTFDYAALLGTPLSPAVAMWLMLGFFVAFAVKLPAVPLHPWLPDAHTEAPTAGSVVLAGLLRKTGAYGLLRFVVPLFPGAAASFAPIGMALGVIGIIYGAVLAFGQTDLKRLVASTSVSHLGFVLLGVFAWNKLALQGAILQMICHGLSTGGLFMVAGMLQDRLGTRDLRRMSGLWALMPRLGAATLVFVLASLGLPGLGNFVAEFLVLLGAYQVNVAMAVAASIGLVLAMVYALWIMHRVFFGPMLDDRKPSDLGLRETLVMAAMVVALVWLGLFPQRVLNVSNAAIEGLQRASGSAGEQYAERDRGETRGQRCGRVMDRRGGGP